MKKELLIICDLGHAGHRIPYLSVYLSRKYNVTVVTPSANQSQLEYLGINNKAFFSLCKPTLFPMKYQRFAHLGSSIQGVYLKCFRLFEKALAKRTLRILEENRVLRSYSHLLLDEPDISWLKSVLDKIVKLQETKKFDLILSSSSPFVCHIVAFLITEKFDIPWVADYRDLWSQNYNQKATNQVKLQLEQEVLMASKLCITATHGLGVSLSEIYAGPIQVIHNYFVDQVGNPSPFDSTRPKFIVYTGTIYENNQEIDNFLRALQDINLSQVRYVLQVCGYGCAQIREWYTKRGMRVPKYVQLRNHVSKRESLEQQARGNILLLFDWKINLGVESTKLMEYLPKPGFIMASGRHPSSRVAEILKLSNRGQYFTSQSEIVSFLRAADKDESLLYPERNDSYLAQFAFIHQAKTLEAALERVVVECQQ
jgi:hypothetical protein